MLRLKKILKMMAQLKITNVDDLAKMFSDLFLLEKLSIVLLLGVLLLPSLS
jgi:hypothetical protein